MAKAQPKRDDRLRQSIKLKKDQWDGIDRMRFEHPGKISRITWITEAILEKLQRNVVNAPLGRVTDA